MTWEEAQARLQLLADQTVGRDMRRTGAKEDAAMEAIARNS